jgi:translation initiation factor 1A
MEDQENFNAQEVEAPSEYNKEGQMIGRVKLPRGKEVLGRLEQRLGASRMSIKCFDGKTRICRVPGRLKRRLWLREGDIVIVEPWEHQPDEKGDVLYKYSKAAVEWLRQKGFIKIEEEF